MGPIIAPLLAVLASQPGSEPKIPDACAAARAHYEALSLEEALAAAEEGLSQAKGRPLACLEVKALALIVLGRLDEARGALTELFERAPDHPVEEPSLSPSQRASIELIRESVRPLEASVKARWLIYDAIRVDVALSGGLRDASHVRLRAATLPEGAEQSSVVALVGRAATATIAVPAHVEVGRVRVSGQVLNELDRVLSQFSTELLLPPRPEAPKPIVVESGGVPWLVWAGMGVAAIGAAAVIVVLAQPDSPDCGGTLGCAMVSEP